MTGIRSHIMPRGQEQVLHYEIHWFPGPWPLFLYAQVWHALVAQLLRAPDWFVEVVG